jgi:hypothetical protein
VDDEMFRNAAKIPFDCFPCLEGPLDPL